MAFPGSIYAPPGVYTRTLFENPTQGLLEGLRLPIYIGTGSESLTQNNLEVVRGSSSQADQRVPQEDETGRAVLSLSQSGTITLGDFNSVTRRIQVRHYPIVDGNGTGTTATKTSSVLVTINGQPITLLSMDATRGLLELSTTPDLGDDVRVTYFFKRTDTTITDTLSEQVTPASAQLIGGIGQSFAITSGVNDTFLFTVDDETDVTVTFPPGTWTAADLAVFCNTAATGTTLVASTTTNNFGNVVLVLTADGDLSIGNGTANTSLGFSNGQATFRNKVFYTFNGPIVDGSNGGVTTTDPADVTVRVDGVQVIPTAVNGASRAITLPFAPAPGSVVTVTYDFNTWQDTYDYLAHVGVTDIFLCGVSPGRSDFLDGADFILSDDKIVWGTAALVAAGDHTTGATLFDDTQVSATLVDDRTFLAPCAAVVDSSVAPAVESRTQFQLPLQPTTGNGRDTPLGTSLYNTVANGRLDLPTNRPDLVAAYWGYTAQDALERGAVEVLSVEGTTITLKSAVPVGASVYATFWYNLIGDQTYSVECVVKGASGVGTYQLFDENGDPVFTPKYGSKSAGLTGITLQFPSGSERRPDVHFETPFSTTYYAGPVEETVTVEFATVDPTVGAFTSWGAGPYEIILNASDRIRLVVDGAELASGAGGIDLGSVNGIANLGFVAMKTGNEIEYDAASGYTTYDIDSTNDTVSLTLDGVLVTATAATGTGNVADYVTAINTAALASGSELIGAGVFNSAFVVTAGEYDEVRFHYTGATSGASGILVATLTPGTYASGALLAAEVETQLLAQIATLGIGFAGLAVTVTANSDSRLVITLTKATADAAGYFEFITHGTAAQDFSVVAGFDTHTSAGGKQSKLLDGPIARRFTVTGPSGALLHDRVYVRSRVVPGFGTVYPFHLLSYAGLTVEGGTGSANCGLEVGSRALAGWRACVLNSTVLGNVGFAGGQVASGTFGDARDGQPIVTFYAAGGTEDQNNVFQFNMDGTPVTVQFTDAAGVAIASGASADVPLGPASVANTVLAQIRAALTAAGIASPTERCVQEGAGIRLYSATDAATSSIAIGTGNANDVLGFTDSDQTGRTLVDPKVLASALMAYSGATLAAVYLSWTTPVATYMTAEALASTVTDSGGAEYLFLQSTPSAPDLGTTSSIAFAAASSASILRPTTGLDVEAGDGGSGEAGISGFFVTSSDPVAGSGSANNSLLNGGTGQDGLVGQSYRDLVTGLTFTVLTREGGAVYPVGETFTFNVRKVVTTDANLPTNAVPGIELLVANTSGVAVGDTALVSTFERGGSEPAVGDLYYVSYNYAKQDYDTKLFTKFSTIEAEYGTLSSDNPVTLAAYLAILNGAVLVGIKQVQKDTDANEDGTNDTASVQAYINAVDGLEGALPGGILPDILVALRGDSTTLFSYMTKHADIQSDIRYRAERTVIGGLSAGTEPKAAGAVAQAIQRTRFRLVYPDIMVVPIPRASGPDEETLVDGTYLAAMLSGSVVSPNSDVATPWTNRRLVGATRLARTLDAVEQNQVASKGVTIIEDRPPVLRVRQGLTSDMSGVLTKLPTIVQITDEVQQQARGTLERFIGQKFLPGVISQIEGQLANTLKMLVDAQILAAYTGVRAQVSADDATTAEVEAFIQPVFPLLYIVITFNLRSSL
jgi:hypothetical protein